MTSAATELEAEPYSLRLARRVRGVLAERQIVGTSAAESLGLAQSGFSRRYRGLQPWSIDEVYALAAFLGVDVTELLPRLDSNQQPFVSQHTQVSKPLAADVATVSRLFPGPVIQSPVPSHQPAASPSATEQRSRATHSPAQSSTDPRAVTAAADARVTAEGTVTVLATYRAGRNVGTRSGARRNPTEETA